MVAFISIMNLNALSLVELGAFPKFRVRIPNSSKFNHASCFFNPNFKMSPRSLSSRSVIITLPSNTRPLPSFLQRDCTLRPRVRATTKDDDDDDTSDDSSSDDEDSDLWINMSQIDPDYVHYGLIYYNVLALSCQITWMLNFNSQTPEREKKDSLSCFKRIIKRFSVSDVKAIEGTNHYKIAELFLKQKCSSHPYILSVFEQLPSMQQAEFINDFALELMLIRAIDIVKINLISNMTEEICDLITKEDDYAPNIAASTNTSKFMVAQCALVLRRQLHELLELHDRLWHKFNFSYDVIYYMDSVEKEIVARGFWPSLFQKYRVVLLDTHDCIIEIKNALQKINSSMMGVGRLVCECMNCYDFKEHMMSTMEMDDDFDDIQKNLKLADENLEQLLHVKSAGELSSNFVNIRNIVLGFKHSLIAYQSIWRGIRLFDKKINEARSS